jgi:hypothetical protein
MGTTSDYTKHGLDRETWVALCSLILTGPLAKQLLPDESSYTALVEKRYAAVIEISGPQGMIVSYAATPDGAMLFCQCLNVSTVQEGIAHLQALNVLRRASQSD